MGRCQFRLQTRPNHSRCTVSVKEHIKITFGIRNHSKYSHMQRHSEILVRNGFGVIWSMSEFESPGYAQTCGTGCGVVLYNYCKSGKSQITQFHHKSHIWLILKSTDSMSKMHLMRWTGSKMTQNEFWDKRWKMAVLIILIYGRFQGKVLGPSGCSYRAGNIRCSF